MNEHTTLITNELCDGLRLAFNREVANGNAVLRTDRGQWSKLSLVIA